MSRIVGLDYGKKRTGIAVTDPLQLIASPLKSLPSHLVVSFLQDYLTKEDVEAFVVGWPLQLNGESGSTTLFVKAFVRLLKRHFPKTPIFQYDERFTSVIAEKSLHGSRSQKKKKKEYLDAVSASLILYSFMEKKALSQQQATNTSKQDIN